MAQVLEQVTIRVNGESEPLAAATIAELVTFSRLNRFPASVRPAAELIVWAARPKGLPALDKVIFWLLNRPIA